MSTTDDANIGVELTDDIDTPATPPAGGNTNDPAPAEPEPPAPADGSQDDDNGRASGMQRRIDELTRLRRTAEADLIAERKARADLERRLQAATQGQQPQDQGATPRVYTEAELRAEAQRLAQEEARNIAAREAQERQQQAYVAQSNKVYTDGVTKYGEAAFNTALQDLARMGISAQHTPDLFSEMFETDAPAALIHHLGKNPNAAMDLQNMTPVQRGMALAKMSIQLAAAPAQPPLSRAPAPIAPVSGDRASGDIDLYDDNVDDAAWYAARQRQRATR